MPSRSTTPPRRNPLPWSCRPSGTRNGRFVSGTPVVAESSARFARNDQQLPLSFPDDEQVTVTAKPHERLNVEVYLSLEQFRVPYTVYASGPAGRQRTFTGTLHSSLPYDYLILKPKTDE